jgi:hypothetical protein
MNFHEKVLELTKQKAQELFGEHYKITTTVNDVEVVATNFVWGEFEKDQAVRTFASDLAHEFYKHGYFAYFNNPEAELIAADRGGPDGIYVHIYLLDSNNEPLVWGRVC